MKRTAVATLLTALLLVPTACAVHAADNPRETPVVRAIEAAKSSVVNIHSEKTATEEDSLFGTERGRKINGMGTGVVVDERGYIITNHHVVDGVDALRVTLVDGSTYTATVVTFDRGRDLALIKVDPSRALDVMPLGTSSDLMLGETVIAVGNAFGYEHTVTQGIISALGRDVEVNEDQTYTNLIQTDASINPGNSGGPLVNLEGKVIGINVAIRAGAQRIGFAIPIDDARRVLARLISTERLANTYHGIRSHSVSHEGHFRLVTDATDPDSPAADAGIAKGDVIRRIDDIEIDDAVDLERALLGHAAGDEVEFQIDRDGEERTLSLVVGSLGKNVARRNTADTVVRAKNEDRRTNRTWDVLGLKLERLSDREKGAVGPRYRGGLRVVSVRASSPAARNGIRRGDMLVGLHVWETITPDNVDYVLDHPQFGTFNPLKFYIVRGRETLYGHLRIAANR